MNYIKTVWQPGDTITAEKLNHLEGGVEEAANKSVFAPEIVTGEGDVSITYKGDQIGVLSDSGTLTLETKDTICEDDIEVEYTKPQTGIPVGNIVNIVNNTSNDIVISGARYMADSNGVMSAITINPNTTNNGYIFCRSGETTPSSYLIRFNCEAMTDIYNITTNSTPWVYDNSEKFYYYEITNAQPINGETYNVVINNK